MPGSLSNEDEGQDDMDFEDDMPGEAGRRWRRGVGGRPSHHHHRRSPSALNAGKRACPGRRGEGGEGGGCDKHSHPVIFWLFFCSSRWLHGACVSASRRHTQPDLGGMLETLLHGF